MEQVITKRRYYDIGLQIEELLYSGVFKAGERLPSERELSERFNTSRTTIREAIIMLELKGVLNVKQGRFGCPHKCRISLLRQATYF